MLPLRNTSCPLCDAPNECAPALAGTFDTPCWCDDVTVDPVALARLPEPERNRSCLCRKCVDATDA
jgi:hypothetical protein